MKTFVYLQASRRLRSWEATENQKTNQCQNTPLPALHRIPTAVKITRLLKIFKQPIAFTCRNTRQFVSLEKKGEILKCHSPANDQFGVGLISFWFIACVCFLGRGITCVCARACVRGTIYLPYQKVCVNSKYF